MNVAIWLLTALLALPLAEIVVFVLVAAAVGFGWAALAIVAGSLTGALMLRRGGGSHVARMRVVLGPQRLSALETDSAGTMYVLAAILLLIPGFITDVIGVLLLVKPLRRAISMLIKRAIVGGTATRRDGVVDLGPQEWRQVPERQVRDQRRDRES
jgi:UPF0716 protein FxsA